VRALLQKEIEMSQELTDLQKNILGMVAGTREVDTTLKRSDELLEVVGEFTEENLRNLNHDEYAELRRRAVDKGVDYQYHRMNRAVEEGELSEFKKRLGHARNWSLKNFYGNMILIHLNREGIRD